MLEKSRIINDPVSRDQNIGPVVAEVLGNHNLIHWATMETLKFCPSIHGNRSAMFARRCNCKREPCVYTLWLAYIVFANRVTRPSGGRERGEGGGGRGEGLH